MPAKSIVSGITRDHATTDVWNVGNVSSGRTEDPSRGRLNYDPGSERWCEGLGSTWSPLGRLSEIDAVASSLTLVQSDLADLTDAVDALAAPAPDYGTSFPGSPSDGQRYTRTDHGCASYVYSSAASGWLSIATIEVTGYDVTLVTSGAFLLGEGAVRFASGVGRVYGYKLKCVGMALGVGLASTGTVAVTSNATAVTNASVSLSSGTVATSEALLSAAIDAGTYLGFKCTSGSLLTSCNARATLRRFET